jgi:histidyl-tRNA synthetase
MATEALGAIGIAKFEILLNNRKILGGLVEKLGLGKAETDVFRALDKLDKIGQDGVRTELEEAGVEPAAARKLLALVSNGGEGQEDPQTGEGGAPPSAVRNNARLEKAAAYSPKGAEELRQIIQMLEGEYGLSGVRVDLSLVRGLGYYTGPIFEIRAEGGAGSVAGGGRYDKLLEIYGQADTAVGISLGIERLMALEEEQKESKGPASPTQVLVVEIGIEPAQRGLVMEIARKLRAGGIAVETDLNERNMDKQLKYANANSIPFALIVGRKELESGQYGLKDLRSGQQDSLKLDDAAKRIKEAAGE